MIDYIILYFVIGTIIALNSDTSNVVSIYDKVQARLTMLFLYPIIIVTHLFKLGSRCIKY